MTESLISKLNLQKSQANAPCSSTRQLILPMRSRILDEFSSDELSSGKLFKRELLFQRTH